MCIVSICCLLCFILACFCFFFVITFGAAIVCAYMESFVCTIYSVKSHLNNIANHLRFLLVPGDFIMAYNNY